VTFVALLGGVAAFGFIGIVLGPVVVAVATALLNAYLRPATALVPAGRGTEAAVPPRIATTEPLVDATDAEPEAAVNPPRS